MFCGCSESPSEADDENSADIQDGGYYSFVSVEGDYKVLKVLLAEENVVHFCYYNNLFKERPTVEVVSSLYYGKEKYNMFVDIKNGQQTTGSKHVALELNGWDDLAPVLLSNGDVSSNEFKAYEDWKNGDQFVLPAGTKVSN
jgi:hypothetical protein